MTAPTGRIFAPAKLAYSCPGEHPFYAPPDAARRLGRCFPDRSKHFEDKRCVYCANREVIDQLGGGILAQKRGFPLGNVFFIFPVRPMGGDIVPCTLPERHELCGFDFRSHALLASSFNWVATELLRLTRRAGQFPGLGKSNCIGGAETPPPRPPRHRGHQTVGP